VPRSKNEWSYPSTPPDAFMALCSAKAQGQLYLYLFTFTKKKDSKRLKKERKKGGQTKEGNVKV
jgi:hypothetical protein